MSELVPNNKVLWAATALVYPTIAVSGDEIHFLGAADGDPDTPGSTVEENSTVIPMTGTPRALFEIDTRTYDFLTLEGAFLYVASGGITVVSADSLRVIAAGVAYWDSSAHVLWGTAPNNFRRDLSDANWDNRLGQLSLDVQGGSGGGNYSIEGQADVAMSLANFAVLAAGNNVGDLTRWRVRVGERTKLELTPDRATLPLNVTNIDRVFVNIHHLPIITTTNAPTITGEIRAVLHRAYKR